jgi:hypothetical protein
MNTWTERPERKADPSLFFVPLYLFKRNSKFVVISLESVAEPVKS